MACRRERERISGAAFGAPGLHDTLSVVTPTLNVSYAPDVFGGTRRQIESLAAQAENQRFQLEATYLTLTSNVVVAAVQEASLRGQIAATNDIIRDQAQQLGLVQRRYRTGRCVAGGRADASRRSCRKPARPCRRCRSSLRRPAIS